MKITAMLLMCLLQRAVSSPYGAAPFGGYTYSYNSGVSSDHEGAYSYVDTNGQEPVRETPEVARARQEHLDAVARAQALVSGARGVAVPQPVADTPEVAAARAHHLAIVQDAHARSGVVSHYGAPVHQVQQVWGVSSTPAPVQDTVEVAAAKAKHLAAVEEAKAKLASTAVRSGPSVTHQQSYSTGSSYSQRQQSVFAVTSAPPTPVPDTIEVAAAKAQHLAAVAQAAARVSSSHSIAAQYFAPSAAPAISRYHYPNVPSDLSAPRYTAPAPAPIAAPAWPASVAVRYNTIATVEDAGGRYVADDEGRYIPSREDAEGQYDARLDAEGQYDSRLNAEGQYVPSLNDEGQWVPSANEGQYVAGREDQSSEDNMPYSYSYSDGLSSKAVEYESDNVNGFRASGTNLPQAQAQAPGSATHARNYYPPGPSYAVPAYRAPVAAYGLPAPPPRPIAAAYAAPVAAPAVGFPLPEVPADTPEVAAAKAAHFAAHREAGARLANAYSGR